MDANKNITATFTAVAQYTLTTTVVGQGSVSLAPTGGVYNAGTVVAMKAAPAAGYAFSNWSDDTTGTTNPLSITMSTNKSVTANFVVSAGTSWEAEDLTISASSPAAQVAINQTGASNSSFVQFGTIPTDSGTYYIQLTIPSISAGRYSVSYLYKSHSNRGNVQMTIDGINVGGLLDHYATPAVQQVSSGALGNVTLAAGTHLLRWTISSKNTSSAGYGVVIDKIIFDAASSIESGRILQLPTETALLQNYPNPFNPTTDITFALSAAENISLKIYDLLGKEVATVAEGRYGAGAFTASFDAKNMNSGVYFYTLRTSSGFVQTRKLLLMK